VTYESDLQAIGQGIDRNLAALAGTNQQLQQELEAADARADELQKQLDALQPKTSLIIGMAISGNADPTQIEGTVGPLGGHRTYFGSGDAAKLGNQAIKDYAAGRTPYISVNPNRPAVAGAYTKVATSSWINSQMKSLSDATPDGEKSIFIIGNESDRVMGVLNEATQAEWTAMMRRAIGIAQGYPKVGLSVGFSDGSKGPTLVAPDIAEALYGFYWDPYEHMTVNGQDHWTPFVPRLDLVRTWLDKVNPDCDSGYMETGIRAEALALDPQWYDKRAQELIDHKMKRFTYFNSNSGNFGGWALDTKAELDTFTAFNKKHLP
jgi:hypothetical protein